MGVECTQWRSRRRENVEARAKVWVELSEMRGAEQGGCKKVRRWNYGSIGVPLRETRHSGSWSHCAIIARKAFKRSMRAVAVAVGVRRCQTRRVRLASLTIT